MYVPASPRSRTRPPFFFDDFLGTAIDLSKWIVLDRISDQANGEVNCMVPANISVAGSVLSGVSKFEDHTCGDSVQAPVLKNYTSWQIQQQGQPFRYGTIDVRAKLPGGTGIWPTIFLLGFLWQPSQPDTANIPYHNWPVGGWQAGSMVWSVDAEDGVGFRTLSSMSGANVPNVLMYLAINAAIGGTGGGTPVSTTFPQTFQIDFVRIVQ